MKAMPSGTMASIFRWPARRQAGLLFPLLLGLSAAIHVLSAFVFDIRYPEPTPPERPTVSLQLAIPGSPLANLLVPASPPDSDAPARSLLAAATHYRPGFETRAAGLQEFPAAAMQPVRLLHREPGPVRQPSPPAPLPGARSEPEAPRASTTGAVYFSPSLSGRSPQGPEPRPPVPEGAARLSPASFLTAVAADGTVLYCFRQETSGDEAIDRAGEVWVRAHRFVPARETTWGTARCVWGQPAAR